MEIQQERLVTRLRKFYKVTNCETGSSELVLADGHVDALSFYRKKNNVERSVTLECADFFVRNSDGDLFMVTKLSELPDNCEFAKALPALGWCNSVKLYKICDQANGMVRCRYVDDTIKPDSFFKGSVYVTVEVQK